MLIRSKQLKQLVMVILIGLFTFGMIGAGPVGALAATQHSSYPKADSGPDITNITSNLADFPGVQVPQYEKFEITFQVDTVAENLQFPFDQTPPAGVQAGVGISVDALFTPDNWLTVYRQPAFYYQDFEYEVNGDKEWIYPTERFSWKVRFSPDKAGEWQYKLIAQDYAPQKLHRKDLLLFHLTRRVLLGSARATLVILNLMTERISPGLDIT